MHIHFCGLDWIVLIMDGRSRTCQIIDFIHLNVQRVCDVMAKELEIRVIHEVQDITLGARVEIVDAEDVITILQQPFTKVRTQKAGASRYGSAFTNMHDGSFLENSE